MEDEKTKLLIALEAQQVQEKGLNNRKFICQTFFRKWNFKDSWKNWSRNKGGSIQNSNGARITGQRNQPKIGRNRK